jgi:hypothetical protein
MMEYLSSIDPTLRTLPDSVYLIWQTVLLIVVIVIVPLAIFLLQRTLNAAISIRRYLHDMLAAGVGIAENTSSVTALNDTIAVAGGMLETAGNLKEHSGTIATVLSERAKGG